jgi:hypothetical protein
MGNDDEDELRARARQGAQRALDELHRTTADLSKPWPRVSAETLAKGRAAAESAAEALRRLAERLDVPNPPRQ